MSHFKFRFSRSALLILALFVMLPYPLCAQTAERPIRVAARICPPFVMNDAGRFSGISIFLWDNIAEELGLDYSVEEYNLNRFYPLHLKNRTTHLHSRLKVHTWRR